MSPLVQEIVDSQAADRRVVKAALEKFPRLLRPTRSGDRMLRPNTAALGARRHRLHGASHDAGSRAHHEGAQKGRRRVVVTTRAASSFIPAAPSGGRARPAARQVRARLPVWASRPARTAAIATLAAAPLLGPVRAVVDPWASAGGPMPSTAHGAARKGVSQTAQAQEGAGRCARQGLVMGRHRQPQQKRIPAERSRAFDIIAGELARDSVMVACTSRAVRRQYLRGVAKRGGDVDRLHFVTAASLHNLPERAVDDLRGKLPAGIRLIDVRSASGAGMSADKMPSASTAPPRPTVCTSRRTPAATATCARASRASSDPTTTKRRPGSRSRSSHPACVCAKRSSPRVSHERRCDVSHRRGPRPAPRTGQRFRDPHPQGGAHQDDRRLLRRPRQGRQRDRQATTTRCLAST